jgi:hypothetical protein
MWELMRNWMGGGGSASLGPNSLSDMGAAAPTVGGALPTFNTNGVTANGINFDKVSAGAVSPSGLGMNLGTGQLALSGLGALGSLWGGMQAQGLAKKQFDFTKSITNTNLANQIRSFNTGLEDRTRSRGFAEGQTQAQMDDYLARNRMTRSA